MKTQPKHAQLLENTHDNGGAISLLPFMKGSTWLLFASSELENSSEVIVCCFRFNATVNLFVCNFLL